MPALAPFVAALLDLLYPPRCAGCGEDLSAAGPFCAACAEAVLEVPPGCAVCGLPGPDARCGRCYAAPPAFQGCRAAALLGGPVADAIHAFKYGDRPALARPLGGWLARAAAPPAGAVVVPVPLARRRRLARGYDQAALLAAAYARAADAPLLRGAVRRIRETRPQVGRGRDARRRNVEGAFGPGRGRLPPGARVVLVDDVVTTGATADACARALRAAGAAAVEVVALARAE